MKKGQKVRVKSNNKVGVIADSEFFYWKGRKNIRYEVRFEDQLLSCWYPAEALALPTEVVKVTIEGDNGKLFLNVNWDWSPQGDVKLTLTGHPENLKQHKGLHLVIAGALMEALRES